MLDKVASVILFLVGVINLAPIVVFFDPSKTAKLYGLPVEGESLAILMRHRGTLLGLVGLTLILAAIKPEFRTLAISLALISKLAFIFLIFTASNYTSEIRQVALIDVGAIVLLLVVAGIQLSGNNAVNYENADLHRRLLLHRVRGVSSGVLASVSLARRIAQAGGY
jgi:hypothetical protein